MTGSLAQFQKELLAVIPGNLFHRQIVGPLELARALARDRPVLTLRHLVHPQVERPRAPDAMLGLLVLIGFLIAVNTILLAIEDRRAVMGTIGAIGAKPLGLFSGMLGEGAVVGVLGGLVGVPVIAVPTSIGYGASFKGLTALLGMLNSCASNVSVVNIDNGFGAGYVASLINRL